MTSLQANKVWMVAVALGMCTASAMAADFDCLIEPRKTVEIRGAVTGLITAVNVRRGDVVKAGQVLVEIDPGLDRASAEVAAFRATMLASKRMAEARVEFTEGKATRMTELAAERFVSVQERDNAIAEKRLAAAGLDENMEERKLATLEHKRLLEQLRLRTLRAPIDGVVTDRLMHPGELVGNGESAKPILKLADLSVLHVEVLLPVVGWDRVRLGQSIEVTPDLPRAPKLNARVVAIDRVFDAASGSFGVQLESLNPGSRVPAGVRCKATFSEIPAPIKRIASQ